MINYTIHNKINDVNKGEINGKGFKYAVSLAYLQYKLIKHIELH